MPNYNLQELNLRFWLIDDLQGRRDAHQKIIRDFFQSKLIEIPEIRLVCHPRDFDQQICQMDVQDFKSKIDLIFSDYNMEWQNVEWDKKAPDYIDSFDDFPGTVKVIEQNRDKIDNFLLVMLSTMVVPAEQARYRSQYQETEKKAWTYEDVPLSSTEIAKIHKLSKPFSVMKLEQVLEHLNYLLE